MYQVSEKPVSTIQIKDYSQNFPVRMLENWKKIHFFNFRAFHSSNISIIFLNGKTGVAMLYSDTD